MANIDKVSDEYKNSYVPDYLKILEHYYLQHEGPYLLGNKVTYADFAVYQSLDNDKQIGALPVCGLYNALTRTEKGS